MILITVAVELLTRQFMKPVERMGWGRKKLSCSVYFHKIVYYDAHSHLMM